MLLHLRFLTHLPPLHRTFSTVPRLLDTSHYEILNLPPHATAKEIKARFYELSKRHHPDRNRHDPHASKKFARITTAYSILSHADSRKKYDRDHGHLRRSTASGPHATTSPAGGRPASGLSRRRTQQQGPPPSFFRDGGYATYRGHMPGGGIRYGGMGPGDPADADKHSVPHFNYDGKQRQHEKHERRQERRRKPLTMVDPGLIMPFLAVSSVLLITIGGTAVLMTPDEKDSKKKWR